MSTPPRNIFGPLFPTFDPESMVSLLDIGPGERVLEVGGAGNTFPRADLVCDLSFASAAQRNGAPAVLREDRVYVEAPAEALPFEDQAFDFVYCTQVLEHVRDPEAACRELSRVARRGFVELPTPMGELLFGNPSHRWLAEREGEGLLFKPRPFIEHPLENLLYGPLFSDRKLRCRVERDYRNLFNQQLLFEGRLPARVERGEGAVFNYDNPTEAGRAHYSFARNILLSGGDPSYTLPDCLEARRLLGDSEAARMLHGLNLARLMRSGEALAALEGLRLPAARALAAQVERFISGEPVDLLSLPRPPADPLEIPPRAASSWDARPLVSVVVAGSDSALLRAAAESVLTQDYPQVQVVVSAALEEAPLREAFHGLSMPRRLVLQALGRGAGLGACLNRAASFVRGAWVGFLMEDERFLPHHLDRLVAPLLGGGGQGAYSDRLLLSGEGVLGPEIQPGNPASCQGSLSTLVAARAALDACGPCPEESGQKAPLRLLLKLAGQVPLIHVREVTVTCPGPLPTTAGALDVAGSASRLDPAELYRYLLAAHGREEGLRGRIKLLEKRLLGSDP